MKSILNLLGFAAITLSIGLLSCEKDKVESKNEPCFVSNPTEELDWLNQEIQAVQNDEYSYFAMATYNGETVFYNGNCNPAVNYVSIVKSCAGNKLGNTNDLSDALTNVTIVWKHADSKCNL